MPPPQDSETSQWFASEVQPHESALRRYLHGIVGVGNIEDIVQETYVRLLSARQKGSVRSSRGLLFAIARNAARDLFRRHTAAKTTLVAEMDDLCVFDESPSAPEIASRRQEIDLLTAAIKSLPERCRLVLMLRKFEHLSQKEIACRLGISEHTVEAQLNKALKRCEKFFEKHGFVPPR